MPRFYVPAGLAAGAAVELPANVVRHLHVLRIRPFEEIVLFNGNGCAYPARLRVLEKRRAVAEIASEEHNSRESPLRITLVQAVSGGERMDFTLQKSTELGVSEIRPVFSARSIVRLDEQRACKRTERWQEIVIAACEQSGRNTVPQVLPPLAFGEALAALPAGGLRLLMGLNRACGLKDIAPAPQSVVFMVGPEGGWTDGEERAAADAGFRAVTLGPRTLRTETASLAAIASMQALWGDLA